MPTPPERVGGKAYGTTNIRRPNYGHWRKWMGVEKRCVVPATSFAEPSLTPGDKDPATGIQRNFWFALDETRPSSSSPASGRPSMGSVASRTARETTSCVASLAPTLMAS